MTLSVNDEGTVVTGSSASGGTVFTITVDAETGEVTLNQSRAVVHGDPTDGDEADTPAKLSAADLVTLTATIIDGDLDTDSATRDIGLAFNFEDDGPTAPTLTVTSQVVEDESAGVNAAADPNAADDSDDAALAAFFSDNGLPAGTTISYARSAAPLVSLNGGSFGNDGEGDVNDGVAYTLSLKNGDGTNSALSTTAGTQIFLYMLGDLVVGRVGTETGAIDTPDAGGAIAFAIGIDDDGFAYIAHRLAINSGTGGSTEAAFDNVVALAGDALRVTVTYTDGDDDTASSDPVDVGEAFAFQDDGPSITDQDPAPGVTKTVDHSNTIAGIQDVMLLGGAVGQSKTGFFAYDIGSDAIDYTTGSDFVDADGGTLGVQLSLTGSVDNAQNPGITNAVVTRTAEDADSASFAFSFNYDKDPITAGIQLGTAGGTLVFDKDAGTFTVTMTDAIDGFAFSVLHTNELLAKAPPGNTGHPEIVVSELDTDTPGDPPDGFYVQFTANSTSRTVGFGFNATGDGAAVGDTAFNAGDLISNSREDWVSATQTTNGVAGDTIQKGELLTLRFFETNILGDVNPGAPGGGTEKVDPTAVSDGLVIKFDGIGNSEDLMLILHLIDAGGNETTRAVLVQNGDIIKGNANVPAPYNSEFTLDNNDGLVILEANDYNGAGETYQIQGVQIMQSANGLSGLAIDLNKVTGDNGGSMDAALQNWDATDNDVLKIVDIGFVQQTSGTIDASLQFQFAINDGDGDFTGLQTINVDVSNDFIVV